MGLTRGAFLVALLGITSLGCIHYGQARLPPKAEFFVTTGDMPTKEYQPVALVVATRMLCTPCGLSLESGMTELEGFLKDQLIEKAKAAGANGIINLSYHVVPMQGFSQITARGLAVRF
jgi:hypothetical protein